MSKKNEVQKQLIMGAGLSEKETIIYELLLEQGELTGGEIERVGKQKKNTYTLLRSLLDKGMISISNKSGKRYYVPAPPERLLLAVKEERRAIAQKQLLLEQAMPELSQRYRERVGQPVVQHYSGMSGLRRVFDEVYAPGKNIVWGCIGNEMPSKKFHDEIINKYKRQRIQNGIKAITISPDSERARELKKTEKQDLKEKFLIDGDKYPMPAEIDTWDDKVAMMSFARGDFSALLIDHPDFARTLQSLIKLAAKRVETDPRGSDERKLDKKS